MICADKEWRKGSLQATIKPKKKGHKPDRPRLSGNAEAPELLYNTRYYERFEDFTFVFQIFSAIHSLAVYVGTSCFYEQVDMVRSLFDD